MNPVLKQRKIKSVSGWLTRDADGSVTRWSHLQEREGLRVGADGRWHDRHYGRVFAGQTWTEKLFKKLYTGIPRKWRATYVQIEIVVD